MEHFRNMEAKEFQKIVNPIYTTAKGTVLMLMYAGNPGNYRF